MKWFKRRPISPRFATPAEAVQFIASICDGAVARDGFGFQKEHVEVGHAMARIDPSLWEPWQHDWAMFFVRCYRRQLSAAGFDVTQMLQRGRARRCRRSDLPGEATWQPDPFGFAELRWWNGSRWSGSVSFTTRFRHDSGT